MTKPLNPATAAKRQYVIALTLSMIAYMAVLVATRIFFAHLAQPWESIIALLPVVPVLFAFFAVVKLVNATDEFLRKILVDSLATAGGLTALAAVTYGFLEGETLRRPSAWATYVFFMCAWLVATFVLRARYR